MNSKEILISIIVPTYNRKELVIKLIDSLSNQKNKNFEIIVIDDGSTDDTYNILKKLFHLKIFQFIELKILKEVQQEIMVLLWQEENI